MVDRPAGAGDPARQLADLEARLSWRKNLQNRPLGLAGLLDARGQVDVRNIIPVLHDAEARKAYGKKGPSVQGGYLRGTVSGWQNPTYEQMTAGGRSKEVGTYIQRGIPRERVQGPNRPMLLMPNYLPTTGVDVEQETGDINEMYRAYSRSEELPAHEGFHRLRSNTEGVWSPEQRTEIQFQIPFMKKYNSGAVQHMFLGGVEFNRAPEALKKDPRFKAFTDRVIVRHFNTIAKVARERGENREVARRFIDDPDVRSYFLFKGDIAEKPKDKYYELVEERYNQMVDILQPPEDAQPSEPEEEKSWWQRQREKLFGKADGGPIYASEILHMAEGGSGDGPKRDLRKRDAAIQDANLQYQIEGGVKGGSLQQGFDPDEAELLKQLAINLPPVRTIKALMGAAKGLGALGGTRPRETPASLLTGSKMPAKQDLKDVIKDYYSRLTTSPKRSPGETKRAADIKSRIQKDEGVHSLGPRGLTGPRKRTSLQWGPGWEQTGELLGHPSDPEVRALMNDIIGASGRPVTEDILATEGPSFDRTYKNLLAARKRGTGHTVVAYKGEAGALQGDRLVIGHPGQKDSGWLGPGLYASSSPTSAKIYGENKRNLDEGASGVNILPVRLRMENPKTISWREQREIGKSSPEDRANWLQTEVIDKGYDSVIVEYEHREAPGQPRIKDYFVVDESQIRSEFADFDPALADKPGLGKAHGGPVYASELLHMAEGGPPKFPDLTSVPGGKRASLVPDSEASQSTIKRRLALEKQALGEMLGKPVKRDVTQWHEQGIANLLNKDLLSGKRAEKTGERINALKALVSGPMFPKEDRYERWRAEQYPPSKEDAERMSDLQLQAVIDKDDERTLLRVLRLDPEQVGYYSQGPTGGIRAQTNLETIWRSLDAKAKTPGRVRFLDQWLKQNHGKGLLDHLPPDMSPPEYTFDILSQEWIPTKDFAYPEGGGPPPLLSESIKNRIIEALQPQGPNLSLVPESEPRPVDPSNLPALIAKTAALSLPDEPPPKGKGQMFRGIGSLMRRRLFPLIQAAQLGYEHLLSEEQKAEIKDFLASPAHEMVGMDKPGIEYFKDLFGVSEDSTEPRPDPIILSTSDELERQAAKLGEKLAPFASAFTDLKGQTYLLPRNITDNLGIDRAIYEAHEKAVPAARILQETDLGAYEQIVEAVERGDVEAVKPGTIDYYNRIKDTPGLNRASIEEEVVVRELALQEINPPTGQGVGSLAEEARDMTSGPRSTDQGFNIDAFHGTSEPQSEVGADFDVQGDDYIRRFGGSDAKYGSFVNDIGDWFSESPDVADYFAGEMTDFQGMSAFRSRGVPQVYPVKLRLQNPAIFDTYEDLEEAYRDWQDQAGPDEDATGTEFANWLKSAGKDGIVIEKSTTDTGELRKDYVVFDSENVRSRFWKPGDKDFAHGGPIYAGEALNMANGGDVVDIGASDPNRLDMADVEYTMPHWERIKEDPIALMAYDPRNITNIPGRNPGFGTPSVRVTRRGEDVRGYYRPYGPHKGTIAIHPAFTFPKSEGFREYDKGYYTGEHSLEDYYPKDVDIKEIAQAEGLDVLIHELRHKGLYDLAFGEGSELSSDEQRMFLRRLRDHPDSPLSHEARIRLQDLKDLTHYPHGEDARTGKSLKKHLRSHPYYDQFQRQYRHIQDMERHQPRRSDWENRDAPVDTWYQTDEGRAGVDQHEEDYARAQSIALERIAKRWPGWNYEVPEDSPYRSATSTGVGITEPRLSDVLKEYYDENQEYQEQLLHEQRAREHAIRLEDNVSEKAEGGLASMAPEARGMFGEPRPMTKKPRLADHGPGASPGVANLCGVARNMNRSVVA